MGYPITRFFVLTNGQEVPCPEYVGYFDGWWGSATSGKNQNFRPYEVYMDNAGSSSVFICINYVLFPMSSVVMLKEVDRQRVRCDGCTHLQKYNGGTTVCATLATEIISRPEKLRLIACIEQELYKKAS